jgi:ABC-type phosphate transport system permease subunit
MAVDLVMYSILASLLSALGGGILATQWGHKTKALGAGSIGLNILGSALLFPSVAAIVIPISVGAGLLGTLYNKLKSERT